MHFHPTLSFIASVTICRLSAIEGAEDGGPHTYHWIVLFANLKIVISSLSHPPRLAQSGRVNSVLVVIRVPSQPDPDFLVIAEVVWNDPRAARIIKQPWYLQAWAKTEWHIMGSAID